MRLSQHYIVFRGFGQAKFPDGGSVLCLSQLSIASKNIVQFKAVKIDPKIISLL